MPPRSPEAIKHQKEYQAHWRKKNADKCKKYSADYLQRRKASRAKYAAAHPEEMSARKRAWFDKNPDYLRSYYVRNRKSYFLAQARRRANKMGVAFSLSLEDIEIPTVCPVLGIEIRPDARGGFNPNSPSLDRLIPALGYVPGNVRVISNRANLLKRDATADELEAIAAYIRRETSQCP